MAMSEAVKKRLMGTSYNRDRAPWETYDQEMDPLAGCSPAMKLAVENYSKQHHRETSRQNIEEVMRQKELSTEMVKEYRFYRQEELVDGPEKVGHIMSCFEFADKINTVIPCYLSANIRKGLTGLAVYKPKEYIENGQTKVQEWQYVCGVQVGFMHEFSSMNFDSHNLPLNERWRGWRTVTLRLIQMGFITEQQEIDLFGPARGQAARRHLEQLYCFRNRIQKDTDGKDQTGQVR